MGRWIPQPFLGPCRLWSRLTLGRSRPPAPRVIRVLDRIAAWRGYPQRLRMDNGPELVSVAMAEWAEDHDVHPDFIQPGKPTQNSYIERFNRTYREEVLDLYIFSRLSEVREVTDRWLREYN